jgi:subtilisin family serine protease
MCSSRRAGRAGTIAIAMAAVVCPALAQQGSGEAVPREEAAVPNNQMQVSERQPWNELKPAGDAAQAAAASDKVSVLIHLDPQSDRRDRPGVRGFSAARGGVVKYEYDILPNVINVRNIPRADIPALSRLPGVLKVEEDYEVHTMLMNAVPLVRGLQSQITGAGLSATGAGIRVCIVDSGIDSNSIMYSSRIDAAAGWDFVNNDSNPEDDNGHGSHVAGTALGGTNVTVNACAGTESAQGVAPQATLIGVKVLNSGGSGSASNIIAGINRCASTTLPGGQADVINLSLGGGQFSGTCDTDTIAAAVNNASNAGVVVVAAAGNNGFTSGTSTPACASGAIAVAATWDANYPNCDVNQSSFSFCLNSFCTSTCTDTNPSTDQRVCFSNRGSKIDVAAPGCVIFSDDSTVAAGNGLVGFCGTSQASPHVAGLAALLLDIDPTLTPAQVRELIRDGAIDKGAAGFDTSFGWGRIDVVNSLALAAPQTCGAPGSCNDTNACTVDDCVGGNCTHTAVNCNDANACTTDGCNPATGCTTTPVNCNDGNSCTDDACNPASGCTNTFKACGGASDGCCGPSCSFPNDPDCSCRPKNTACTASSQCCSGNCGRNGRCR